VVVPSDGLLDRTAVIDRFQRDVGALFAGVCLLEAIFGVLLIRVSLADRVTGAVGGDRVGGKATTRVGLVGLVGFSLASYPVNRAHARAIERLRRSPGGGRPTQAIAPSIVDSARRCPDVIAAA